MSAAADEVPGPHAAGPQGERGGQDGLRLGPGWRWTRRGLLVAGLLIGERVLRDGPAPPRRRLSGSAVEAALKRGEGVVGDLLVYGSPEAPRALSLRCTHLGCRLQPTASGLSCPCHGSRFDRRGRRLAGPATTDLRQIDLVRDDNGWTAEDRAGDGHG